MAFNGVIAFAISLSIFAALRPYLLKANVDGYIKQKKMPELVLLPNGSCIASRGFSQFYFVYWSNWLGQDIVKTFELNSSNTF
jgi:hypothetical protein